MKKVILIMMAMVLSLASFSKKTDKLTLSGDLLVKSHVTFEVSIVDEDASNVVIHTKTSNFTYKISLKIGKTYLLKFTKGNKVKKLFVTADEAGYMKLDVDFKTDNNAQLCYSELKDNYHLILLYNNDH